MLKEPSKRSSCTSLDLSRQNSDNSVRDGAQKRNFLFRPLNASSTNYPQPSQPQGIMEEHDSSLFLDLSREIPSHNNNNHINLNNLSNMSISQHYTPDTSCVVSHRPLQLQEHLQENNQLRQEGEQDKQVQQAVQPPQEQLTQEPNKLLPPPVIPIILGSKPHINSQHHPSQTEMSVSNRSSSNFSEPQQTFQNPRSHPQQASHTTFSTPLQLVSNPEQKHQQSQQSHDLQVGSASMEFSSNLKRLPIVFNESSSGAQAKDKKDTNVFFILFHLTKFLYRMKRILVFFRPHLLNALQLSLIGDKAAQNFESDGFGVPYPIAEDLTIGTITPELPLSQFANETLKPTNNFNINIVKNTSPLTGSKAHNILSTSQNSSSNNKKDRNLSRWSNFKCRNNLKRVRLIIKTLFCGVSISRVFRRTFQSVRRLVRRAINRIPILDPNAKTFQLWQLLLFLCDITTIIYIPFRFSFSQIDFFETYVYEVSLPIIYAMNILVTCNLGVYDRGTLLESREKILRSYVKFQFWIDLLTASAHFTSSFLYFLRIFSDNHLVDSIRSYFLLNTKINAIQQFLSLAFKILLFSHLFSCAWHSLGSYYYDFQKGWILEFNYQNEDIYVRYIACFYYAVVSMSTIGYGDFHAQTTGERFFMIFAIFFACGLYGYTLNSIGSILSNLKNKSEKCEKKLAQLEEYLSLHSVDVLLKKKARQYLQYVLEQENIRECDGQESLLMLNTFLKEEIKLDINNRVLSKAHSLLASISTNTKFLSRIAALMQEYTFGPEEIIHDSKSLPALYIISVGEVELFLKSNNEPNATKLISTISAGSIFGKEEFFSNNQLPSLTARSIGVTYISLIRLDEFETLLADFPQERERFYYLRDQLNIHNAFQTIHTNCNSCKSDSHSLVKCPFLFYDPIANNNNNHTKLQRILNNHLDNPSNPQIPPPTRSPATSHKHTLKELPFTQVNISGFQNHFKQEIAAALALINFSEDDQDFYEGSLYAIDNQTEQMPVLDELCSPFEQPSHPRSVLSQTTPKHMNHKLNKQCVPLPIKDSQQAITSPEFKSVLLSPLLPQQPRYNLQTSLHEIVDVIDSNSENSSPLTHKYSSIIPSSNLVAAPSNVVVAAATHSSSRAIAAPPSSEDPMQTRSLKPLNSYSSGVRSLKQQQQQQQQIGFGSISPRKTDEIRDEVREDDRQSTFDRKQQQQQQQLSQLQQQQQQQSSFSKMIKRNSSHLDRNQFNKQLSNSVRMMNSQQNTFSSAIQNQNSTNSSDFYQRRTTKKLSMIRGSFTNLPQSSSISTPFVFNPNNIKQNLTPKHSNNSQLQQSQQQQSKNQQQQQQFITPIKLPSQQQIVVPHINFSTNIHNLGGFSTFVNGYNNNSAMYLPSAPASNPMFVLENDPMYLQQQQQYQMQMMIDERNSWTIAEIEPFDNLKAYQIYFPDNNFDVVLASRNEKLKPKTAGNKRPAKRSNIFPSKQTHANHNNLRFSSHQKLAKSKPPQNHSID